MGQDYVSLPSRHLRNNDRVHCLIHFPEFLARKRTPSPSETAIICALLDFVRILIAFRNIDIGTPESVDGTGGSMIS